VSEREYDRSHRDPQDVSTLDPVVIVAMVHGHATFHRKDEQCIVGAKHITLPCIIVNESRRHHLVISGANLDEAVEIGLFELFFAPNGDGQLVCGSTSGSMLVERVYVWIGTPPGGFRRLAGFDLVVCIHERDHVDVFLFVVDTHLLLLFLFFLLLVLVNEHVAR